MLNTAFTNRERWRQFVGERYAPHTNWEDMHIPDIDNPSKFVLDALNSFVYTDDGQISKLVLYKLVDNHQPCDGKTIIRFKELDCYTDFPQPPNVIIVL